MEQNLEPTNKSTLRSFVSFILAVFNVLGIIYLIYDWRSSPSLFDPDYHGGNLMVYVFILFIIQIVAIVLSRKSEKAPIKTLTQILSWLGLIFVILVALSPFLGVPGIGLL